MNVRKGAATAYYPIWHYEFPEMIVLKNNKGTQENRARQLDYAVQLNKHFLKRATAKTKEEREYYLFSPSEVPGLYEAFFSDQEEFERLYEMYSKNPFVRKRKMDASEMFDDIAKERNSTGRIYIHFVDNTNKNSPFIVPIYMSNLCLEIALPTEKLIAPDNKEDGEIALCTLTALNVYHFVDENGNILYKALNNAVRIAIRALDNLLDYQDYPIAQARKATMDRRPLGLSVTNLAGMLAKVGLRYEDKEALLLIDRLMEAISYFAIRVSVDMAKEKGPCALYKETRWAQGILPFERTSKKADDLVKENFRVFDQDNVITEEFGTWELLRDEMMTYGIRNSTLLTQAPTETSSAVVNSTNGIEAPRSLLSVKVSKDGSLPQLVPDVKLYGDKYTTMWSMTSNKAVLEISAVMQRWICQAMSTNTNYNPENFPNGAVSLREIKKDILDAFSLGLKTLYYQNTKIQQEDDMSNVASGCAGGACAI